MNFLRFLLTSIAGASACGPLLAAPPSSAPKPADAEDTEINLENDKTAHCTRLRIENEFIDYKSGDALNTLTYSGSYAVGFKGRKEWQLTLDWPLVHYHAGGGSTYASATGMGDLQLALTHTFENIWNVRWSLGLKTQLDTAMQSQLGDGMYVLSPLAAASWRLNSRVKLMATFQYNHSVAEREGVTSRRTFDFKPGVEFDLHGRWYAYVEYAGKRDFSGGVGGGRFRNLVGSSVKFELGSAWGSNEQWVFALRYEMPLMESSRRGTYVAGVTYRFK